MSVTLRSLGIILLGACLVMALSVQDGQSTSADWVSKGNRLRLEGKYREALAHFEASLRDAQRRRDLDGEWLARTYVANTYADLGRFDDAVKAGKAALEFAKAHTKALVDDPMDRVRDSKQTLATLYTRQKEYGKAIELLQQLLAAEADDSGASLGRPKMLEDLGMNLYLSGQPKAAERTLREAIQAYDSARENRLGPLIKYGIDVSGYLLLEYEQSIDVYRWLEDVLVASGDTDAALEMAERGRAAALAALLRSRLGVPAASLPRIEPLTIAQIKQIARRKNATLVVYSLVYNFDPDHDSRIIFGYGLLDTRAILVWVINPHGEVSFRRIDDRELQQVVDPTAPRGAIADTPGRSAPTRVSGIVTSLRNSLGVVPRDTRPPPARRGVSVVANPKGQGLYRALIEPIEDHLPRDPEARVVVVPQDALFAVPFAALQSEDGTYFVEHHTITMASSIETLDLADRLHTRGFRSAGEPLVVGNPSPMPTYGTPPRALPDLPGAALEARGVATLLKTEPLIGPQATKAQVIARMQAARLVHLATHGILDHADASTEIGPGEMVRADAGLEASVALASPGGESGFLTAKEILRLKLEADLVVLSACSTGRGAVRGDGVVGLSRAFMLAGVPSVITSLWDIPDEATSLLMAEFYRQLQAKQDKAHALRSAMLATKRAFPEPRDWAAFVLMGEPD
jgi:CHAT domain-containing protein/tetratricopeptide (TPR) repeat protein